MKSALKIIKNDTNIALRTLEFSLWNLIFYLLRGQNRGWEVPESFTSILKRFSVEVETVFRIIWFISSLNRAIMGAVHLKLALYHVMISLKSCDLVMWLSIWEEPVSKKCLMHLFIITFSFGRVEMNDMVLEYVLEWFFEYSKINILPL